MKLTGLMAAAVLAATPAMADIQITMKDRDRDGRETESTISVRDGKVAMSIPGDGGMAIYDSQTGELTQVDHKSREYIVVDQETMDQAADQMSAMMKQMEAQLASLPKEQREAMMKMMPGMAGMGGNEKRPAAKIEWTGSKDKVAGYRCRIATITEPDGTNNSACIASADELGMSKDDYQAIASMFETMQAFARRFSSEAPMPSLEQLDGVPIMMKDRGDGSSVELVSVDTDSLEAEIFEVPAGYKRRQMME